MTSLINWLLKIDHSLFQFINGTLSNPFFDWIMPIITNEHLWSLPLLIFALGLIFFGKKRGRLALILLLIAVALTDSIIAQVIRPFVGRMRPSHAITDTINLLTAPGGTNGFVSAHAGNTYALSVILSYFYRQWKPWLFSFAILICFSRVYVGVHYPGDVIFGALFGYGVAWTILTLWVILKMRELKKGRTWVWYEKKKFHLHNVSGRDRSV